MSLMIHGSGGDCAINFSFYFKIINNDIITIVMCNVKWLQFCVREFN